MTHPNPSVSLVYTGCYTTTGLCASFFLSWLAREIRFEWKPDNEARLLLSRAFRVPVMAGVALV